MPIEILNLNHDPHTGQIALSGKEERFCAGGFAVLRTENLVLTPGEGPVWHGFLKTLKEIYHADCFDIDFHGTRTELETVRAEWAGEEDVAYELYFDGVHVDNLESTKYRAERITALYEKIDSYNFAYLNRLFFLRPFQKLVDCDLTACLTKPDESVLNLMNAVLESGNDCLDEAWDAYRNEQLRQETSRNGDQFLNRRLREMQDITIALCPLSWNGFVFMDRKKVLRSCHDDLQKLTDSTAERIKSQDATPEHWISALQIRYCMFFRSCEAAIKQKANQFVVETNQKIQQLHEGNLWKGSQSLINYPLLEPFTPEKARWEAKIPAEASTPEQQLTHLHNYTRHLIDDIYGQYVDHFVKDWNTIKNLNDKNLEYLSHETELLQELLQDSRKRELTDRIKLEEEHKEIEAVQQFLEELTILLYPHACFE